MYLFICIYYVLVIRIYKGLGNLSPYMIVYLYARKYVFGLYKPGFSLLSRDVTNGHNTVICFVKYRLKQLYT